MHVHLYERIWMWGAVVIIALFMATMGFAAVRQGMRPPSHIETIDPATAREDPRFADPGVTQNPDGGVTVHGLSFTFGFQPGEVRVPVNRRVTFRVAD